MFIVLVVDRCTLNTVMCYVVVDCNYSTDNERMYSCISGDYPEREGDVN